VDRRACLPQEYNDFLYALVGEERNETPLTVLSLLARVDVHPWQEAARLSRLPKERAVRDLAAKIRAIPTGLWHPLDCEPIAVRLVELLRNHQKSPASLARRGLSPQVICALAFVWILFVAMLGAFSFEAYRRTTASARADLASSWVDRAPQRQIALRYDLTHH
jgi:hypothetical protein